MSNAIFDGLALVDTTGRAILAATVGSLLLGIAANLWLRARYAGLERDLARNQAPPQRFDHRVLGAILHDAEDAARRGGDVNTQAIIEDNLQSGLKPLLLAERFVKAATGLVIILGLLGTFYGLTLSVGRLVHLVSSDAGGVADVSQQVTTGLTQALMGMAVAFSNSLLGIVSAVILTVVGVVSNVADRRTALMIQIETYLERVLPPRSSARATGSAERAAATFGDAIARLEGSVVRFEAALSALSQDTKAFREFNVHVVASGSRESR